MVVEVIYRGGCLNGNPYGWTEGSESVKKGTVGEAVIGLLFAMHLEEI